MFHSLFQMLKNKDGEDLASDNSVHTNQTNQQSENSSSLNQEAKYAIDKLADIALTNNKKNKKGWLIKFLIVLAIIVVVFWFFDFGNNKNLTENFEHIAVIHIEEPIFLAEDTIEQIQFAFENEKAKAIFLLLNSPGGSAVQSSQIYNQIMKLKKQHKKPIYAFISDVCASGCYYLATASDEIYAHQASLIGSIGVIMQSFGVEQLLEKIGVEPRTYTAGKDKDFLSPFSKINGVQQKHILKQMKAIHQKFIADVKTARGEKLQTKEDLFTGLVWAGTEAEKLGLIDGFYYYDDFAKEKLDGLEYQVYEKPLNWQEKLLGQMGASASNFIRNIKTENYLSF